MQDPLWQKVISHTFQADKIWDTIYPMDSIISAEGQWLLALYNARAPDSRWYEKRSTNSPPSSIHKKYRPYDRRMPYAIVTNMTAELVNDVTYKLYQCRKIRDYYRASLSYQLGYLSGSIREKFENLILIYREYSQLELIYRENRYDVRDYYDMYLYAQGLYNELRVEQAIISEIIHRKEMGLPPLGSEGTRMGKERNEEVLRRADPLKGEGSQDHQTKPKKTPLWSPYIKERMGLGNDEGSPDFLNY